MILYAGFHNSLVTHLKPVAQLKIISMELRFCIFFEDKSVQAFDSFQLSITLKGIARSMKHVPRQAVPLTLSLLTEFLEHLDLNKPKDATFWAFILIGFYCMLSKSNLVPDNIDAIDSRKQLCRVNIKINSHCLLVEIKWSKTIQFSQKSLLIPLLAMPGSSLCLVAAFSNMVKLVPRNPSDPAFMLRKGQAKVAVTYNKLQSKLKQLVQAKAGILTILVPTTLGGEGPQMPLRLRFQGS